MDGRRIGAETSPNGNEINSRSESLRSITVERYGIPIYRLTWSAKGSSKCNF